MKLWRSLFVFSLTLSLALCGACKRTEEKRMLNDKERQELKAMDASLLDHEYFKTPHKASELEAVLAQCRETNADILSRREDLLGFYKKFGISTEMTYEEVKKHLNAQLLAEGFPPFDEKNKENGRSTSALAIINAVDSSGKFFELINKSKYKELYHSVETFEIWASECFLVGDPENRNPYRDLGEFIRAQVKVAVLERLTPILNQAQKKSSTQKAGKETRFFHGRKKRAATSCPVDPAKVQAYAERYALNPNPNFAYYPKGDCADFMSQCLFYGGMPQKKPKEIS